MNSKISVCAIVNIGKIIKNVVVFDENLNILENNQQEFEEISDEDDFPCEDLFRLTTWIKSSIDDLLKSEIYDLKALNFVTYGASFVHLDEQNQPVTPLYSYLKNFPYNLRKELQAKYGSAEPISLETASPDLGMLTSGLQLYWLKKSKPEIFAKVKNSIHFPQYCSFLFSNELVAEYTSLGHHTGLWDFEKNIYHQWLEEENIETLKQPILSSNKTFPIKINEKIIEIGIGMQDISAALMPYLQQFKEPFILLFTGNWNVSVNYFNNNSLTINELKQDGFSSLSPEGNRIKASQIFAGNEHKRQTKHLATYFNKEVDYYKNVAFNSDLIWQLRTKFKQATPTTAEIGSLKDCPFVERNLNLFKSYEEAYHQFMLDLIAQQTASIRLIVGNSNAKKLVVEGEFSNNEIFIDLLKEVFYDKEIYTSTNAQIAALGAAMIIKESWIGKSEFGNIS